MLLEKEESGGKPYVVVLDRSLENQSLEWDARNFKEKAMIQLYNNFKAQIILHHKEKRVILNEI